MLQGLLHMLHQEVEGSRILQGHGDGSEDIGSCPGCRLAASALHPCSCLAWGPLSYKGHVEALGEVMEVVETGKKPSGKVQKKLHMGERIGPQATKAELPRTTG